MNTVTVTSRLRAAFYWTIKTLAWPVTRVYVRLRVQGLGNVPMEGACIVVANHVSYVDPVVLGSAFPRRITFMISEPLYRLLRLRWFYYLMGAVPVASDDPGPASLKATLKTLKSGGVVGIFPEGQRMPNASLGEAKSGAALLAARSGAPVIPAALIGAHRVMPVGSMLPRPYRIRVVLGKPLTFPPSPGRRPSRSELDSFAGGIMKAISDLMGVDPETSPGRGDAATSRTV